LKILRRWNFSPKKDLKNYVLEVWTLWSCNQWRFSLWILRGHSTIRKLKDSIVGFKKRIQKIIW
jgi:hypothetical protein